MVKTPPAHSGHTGDRASIPGSGRSPGGGHGHPLQYSCLENPMDRGAWQATLHRATEVDTTEATQHTHRWQYPPRIWISRVKIVLHAYKWVKFQGSLLLSKHYNCHREAIASSLESVLLVSS